MDDLRRHELHAARGYGNDDRPDGTGRRSDGIGRHAAGYGPSRDCGQGRRCGSPGQCRRRLGTGRSGTCAERRRRRRLAVGVDHRGDPVGFRSLADPLRIPHGADDRIVLHEKLRQPRDGTFPRRHVRVLHCRALHAADSRNHRHHTHRRGRCRDGRHLQLAGDTLAAQYPFLPRIHGIRRIVLRSVRDHHAFVDGQQNRQQSRLERPGRHLLHGPDPRAGILLLHGPDRRFGAYQIDVGRILEPDRHHAGVFRRLRASLHRLRLLPVDAQEAAQKRRMAQLGEGRAGIHRGGARHQVPLGRRPDLPLGATRPRDIPRRMDRDLLAPGALSAGKNQIRA